MATVTGHLLVFFEQRVSCVCVVGHRKRCFLPGALAVAGPAVSAVRPPGELPVVRILVAVETASEGKYRAEVLRLVTRLASCFGMLAQQREARLAVVEPIGRVQRFPAAGGVAFLAVILKRTAMGVLMA